MSINFPTGVGDRIAQEACREPLTVDQLGEIADTLDCTASSLLPQHGNATVSTNPATRVADKQKCGPINFAETTRYPATDAHDRVIDLFVSVGDRDPFMGDCPAWCEMAERGHAIESCDEDRKHCS